MCRLFIALAVFLSLAHASLLPFHLLLSDGTLELPQESCEAGVEEATLITVSVQKCYYIPQTYLQAFIQLEERLVSLGYNEIHHITEPGLIMSGWQETKAPQQQLTIFVAATREPFAGTSLALIDQTAPQGMTDALGDNSPSNGEKPTEMWSDGLVQVLRDRNASTHVVLEQDKRVLLPREAVKLPTEMCRKALQQMTQIESPFFGCYYFPQTFNQVRRQLAAELTVLGYQEGMVHEAFGFNATNWWDTEITKPKLGIVVAYAESTGGSLFFELNYTEGQ